MRLNSLFDGTRMLRAPDGEGGSGGGGDGDKGGGGGEGGSLLDLATGGDGGGSGGDGTAHISGDEKAKPDWLTDDKFFDAEKGEVNTELMFKNLGELQGKFSRGEHKGPEKPEEYEHGLSEEVAAKILVEGENGEPDPLLAKAQAWAHSKGLSQADFKELVGEVFADTLVPMMPEQVKYDPQAEIAKLGPRGQDRVDAMAAKSTQLEKLGVFNEQDVKEFKIACGTAEGVLMVEKMLAFYGEGTLPDLPGGEGAMPSSEELSAMVNDDRYGVDKTFTEKTDQAYARKYGTKPAGSSMPG